VPAELLVLKFALAGKEATRVFVPVVVGVRLQLPVLDPPAPAVSAPEQLSPVPSLTVTVPVGATAAPEVFATVKFTVTGCPTNPLVALVDVIVVDVFAAITPTVSLHELFVSFDSLTTLFGSTAQIPAVGFAKVPAELGVAVNCTVKLVPLGMVTGCPADIHESALPVMPQVIWLELTMLGEMLVTDTVP
jgi:hypothetical protein